jgi:putative photosynthetic complex assembly protein
MTTAVQAPELIPRRALWVGAAALAATLLGAGAYHRWGKSAPPAAVAPMLTQRTLLFTDLPDGGIRIADVASGRTLDTVHGEQGFLRGTLRALVRERRQRGLTEQGALLLAVRADGRLVLADPATGAHIDLQSFGPTNAAVFARWLPEAPSRGSQGARP